MSEDKKIELRFDVITYQMLNESAKNSELSVEELIKTVIAQNIFGISISENSKFDNYVELPWVWQVSQKWWGQND